MKYDSHRSQGVIPLCVLPLALSLPLVLLPFVLYAETCPDRRLTFDPHISFPSYNSQSVASGADRRVHVVWEDDRSGSYQIFYKWSQDGGRSWSVDTPLVQGSPRSMEPVVSASGSEVHVVWFDERDGSREVYYKRSTDHGATWSIDRRLTNDSVNAYGPYSPSLFAAGSDIHLVWLDDRIGSFQLFYKRSTDHGVTWSPDCSLSTIHHHLEVIPSVIAAESLVHLAWNDDRDGNYGEIYYKRSSDGGATWGPDVRLTFNPELSWYPTLAVSGPFVHLAWEEARDGTPEIYYKRSTDEGASWSPDTRLTFNTWECGSPRLAAWGSVVHLVWNTYSYDPPYEIGVFYQASLNRGVSWLPPLLLNSVPNYTCLPSVSASTAGIHVVWADCRDRKGDNNWEIYYAGTEADYLSGTEAEPKWGDSPKTGWKVLPNPFTSFATLPGHETERFSLYDISGRKVGTYRGDRVGEGLRAGVYFLGAEGKGNKPLRVVKIK